MHWRVALIGLAKPHSLWRGERGGGGGKRAVNDVGIAGRGLAIAHIHLLTNPAGLPNFESTTVANPQLGCPDLCTSPVGLGHRWACRGVRGADAVYASGDCADGGDSPCMSRNVTVVHASKQGLPCQEAYQGVGIPEALDSADGAGGQRSHVHLHTCIHCCITPGHSAQLTLS